MTFAQLKARRTADARRRADDLAAYVADHDCTLKEAGQALGIPQDSCTRIWGRIKRGLGAQAC